MAMVAICERSPHSPRKVRMNAWANTGLVMSCTPFLHPSRARERMSECLKAPTPSRREMEGLRRGDAPRCAGAGEAARLRDASEFSRGPRAARPSSMASRGTDVPSGLDGSCMLSSSSISSSASRISSAMCDGDMWKASCSILTPKTRNRPAAAQSVHTCGTTLADTQKTNVVRSTRGKT